MNIYEIKSSGILEYYVLGLLSASEMKTVEGYLIQYPELQEDYKSIQKSLQAYAQANGITPKLGLEQKIIDRIKAEAIEKPKSDISINKSSRGIWPYLLSLLIALGAVSYFWSQKDKYTELDKKYIALKKECDSISTEQQNRLGELNMIFDKGNEPIYFAATPSYINTRLILHHNKTLKQNYIQIQNLPEVDSGMAFQLWSLKEGVDPIPLTVFSAEDGILIPVDFEDNTGTYAITIEKDGGVLSPTLSRLIGTAGV